MGMKFKVNNTIYKVVELDSPHDQVGSDEEAWGITVFSQGLIFLEKNLIPSVKRSTLIHELTHAHLMEYGMNHECKNIEEKYVISWVRSQIRLLAWLTSISKNRRN
jgi:Zn-dependent peptidase ImmA (M78 family)